MLVLFKMEMEICIQIDNLGLFFKTIIFVTHFYDFQMLEFFKLIERLTKILRNFQISEEDNEKMYGH